MKFLAFFVLIQSSFLLAETCTDIRLDKNNGIMTKVKPIDQGSYGICYATAATTVYNAWLMKTAANPEVKELSAFHAAVMYTLATMENPDEVMDIDGGDEETNMRILAKAGVCEKKYFETRYDMKKLQISLNKVFELKKGYDASKVMKEITGLKQIDIPTYSGPDNFSHQHLEKYQKINGNIVRASNAYHNNPKCVSEELESLNWEESSVSKIMDSVYKGQFAGLKADLQRLMCPQSETLKSRKEPKVVSVSFFDKARIDKLEEERFKIVNDPKKTQEQKDEHWKIYDNEIRKIVDQQIDPAYRMRIAKQWSREKLKPDGLPIAVGYCAKKVGSFLTNLGIIDDCGAHASVIIGRRTNPKTGQCQLLIRNSWGEDPSFAYKKSIESEGANFWVDEEVIFSSKTLSLSTYE